MQDPHGRKIAWEQHPVSRQRKSELIRQGFKIMDVRYKPLGEAATSAPDRKEPKLEELTDHELARAYTQELGDAPHHAMKRATIISKIQDARAARASDEAQGEAT